MSAPVADYHIALSTLTDPCVVGPVTHLTIKFLAFVTNLFGVLMSALMVVAKVQHSGCYLLLDVLDLISIKEVVVQVLSLRLRLCLSCRCRRSWARGGSCSLSPGIVDTSFGTFEQSRLVPNGTVACLPWCTTSVAELCLAQATAERSAAYQSGMTMTTHVI